MLRARFLEAMQQRRVRLAELIENAVDALLEGLRAEPRS